MTHERFRRCVRHHCHLLRSSLDVTHPNSKHTTLLPLSLKWCSNNCLNLLPPAAPAHSIPTFPEIHLLMAAIIKSMLGYSTFLTVLVQMMLMNGILLESPSPTLSPFTLCILWMAGSYLNFTFAIQQINITMQSTNTIGFSIMVQRTSHIQPFPLIHTLFVHLIRPTTMLDATTFCLFWKWLIIIHLDTYIHNPFKFASVCGRKMGDRISQKDWNILQQHVSMFQNSMPKFDVPTFLIHVDRGAHVTYHNQAHNDILFLEASQTSNSSHDRHYPQQKVSECPIASPHFFFFKCP